MKSNAKIIIENNFFGSKKGFLTVNRDKPQKNNWYNRSKKATEKLIKARHDR